MGLGVTKLRDKPQMTLGGRVGKDNRERGEVSSQLNANRAKKFLKIILQNY